MTHEKPSASVFKVKKLTGRWWIPGNDRCCYGTLTFDISGEQHLKIIGYLEGQYPGNLQEYTVLYGYCQMNQKIYCVTLFHARYTYLSGPLTSGEAIGENTIGFQDVWIGTRFYEKQEDVKFASFSFGIHNLENWHDERTVFSSDIEMVPTVTAKATMILPPDVNLYEDEKVIIGITYIYRGPGMSEGQLEISMGYCPIVSISSQNGLLPYYGEEASFEYYWYCVYKFFELLLDGYTYFFDLQGFGIIPEIKIQQERMELIFSHSITPKQSKNISPHQVLIPYKKIKEVLSCTFCNFMKHQKNIDAILENLFIYTTTNRYHNNPLPSLLFTLEGLQQVFYKRFGKSRSEENYKEHEVFDANKKKIKSHCPKELHSFINKTIRWQCPFVKRLSRMIQEYRDTFPFISDDICEKLSEELKEIRNQYAHCDYRNKVSWDVIFRLTRFLEYLHYAIILHKAEVPQETIKSCFERPYSCDYKRIEEFVLSRYASKGEKK